MDGTTEYNIEKKFMAIIKLHFHVHTHFETLQKKKQQQQNIIELRKHIKMHSTFISIRYDQL